MENKFEKIKPEVWYNLSDIGRLGKRGLFPFVTIDTTRKYVKSGDLRVRKVGSKKLPRYRIKGQWILDFLEKFEEGKTSR